MLPRIEYSATVPVSVDEAFGAFQDLSRHVRHGVCREVSWVEGEPWQVGSRLRYVLTKPPATLSSVVIACDPPRAVSLIHHALGITTEEHVIFDPLKSGTRIRMTFEFIGTSEELPESMVRETVSSVARSAFESVVASCRQRGGSAGM
jgi:hypothetical protein